MMMHPPFESSELHVRFGRPITVDRRQLFNASSAMPAHGGGGGGGLPSLRQLGEGHYISRRPVKDTEKDRQPKSLTNTPALQTQSATGIVWRNSLAILWLKAAWRQACTTRSSATHPQPHIFHPSNSKKKNRLENPFAAKVWAARRQEKRKADCVSTCACQELCRVTGISISFHSGMQ